MARKRKQYASVEIDNPLDDLSLIQTTTERIENKKMKWQYKALVFLVLSVLAILFVRVFYLQIIQGSHYKELANNNRIRKIVIRAPRGMIKDVNGEIVARNVPSFELAFIPAYLPQEEKSLEVEAANISKLTGVNKNELLKKFKEPLKSDRREYTLIEYLDSNLALKLVEQVDKFPGINIVKTAQREYPYKKSMAHILGYVGKVNKQDLESHPEYLLIDYIGKSGIEESYEKYLYGKHGEHRYEVNSMGKSIRDLGTIAPMPGYDLKLNIDAKLQEKIYKEAEKMMAKNEDDFFK
jgi:penicillin-binding protein 2